MRLLFTALVGAGSFVAVLAPTAPTSHVVASVVALFVAGFVFVVYPWVVGKSSIDEIVAAALDDPDGDWRDDGSGERPGWDGHHLRGLSPHNAWITAPEERGFVMQEPQAPVLPAAEQTVIYDTGLFDLRLRRPKGKRRAGAR